MTRTATFSTSANNSSAIEVCSPAIEKEEGLEPGAEAILEECEGDDLCIDEEEDE